jgi:hypothetical protein
VLICNAKDVLSFLVCIDREKFVEKGEDEEEEEEERVELPA